MRRLALASLALLLTATSGTAVAGSDPELRWIAYVRGNPDRGNARLVTIRSDGGGGRVPIRGGVAHVDLGDARIAYAILGRPDDPSGSRLVRLRIGGGEPVEISAGPEGAFLLGVAAAPGDDVAVQRFVEIAPEVPGHLEGAVEDLARFEGGVLAPPDRPPGTTDTVVDASASIYDLLLTNDPEGRLSHAEQVNVFVRGTTDPVEPPPEAMQVDVRGQTGSFYCGASACFLDWREEDVAYSAGEFGSADQAVGFAESLQLMEDLVGEFWRISEGLVAPQLVLLRAGGELELQSVEQFCECSYEPHDWNDAGTRLLVVLTVEGFTTLEEYGAGGEPKVLLEGTDGTILDAAFGPGGVLLLQVPDGRGRVGEIRTLEGETLVEDVRAFDVEGATLAYVTRDRRVVVRDLRSDEEREVGRRAFSVSVGADLLTRATPEPPTFPPEESEPFPWLLVTVIAAAGLALVVGVILIVRSRRRRA